MFGMSIKVTLYYCLVTCLRAIAMTLRTTTGLVALALVLSCCNSRSSPAAWESHVIDASLLGADGARFEDANGDGLADIVTGWEQSGLTRVYFRPAPGESTSSWEYVTVGISPDVEDAVVVDLDNDGAKDVVTASEGDAMRINFHWAPSQRDGYTDSSQWRTEVVTATQGAMQWMFTVPYQIDGLNGIDLIAAGKRDSDRHPQPYLGWLKAPENARDVNARQWIPLVKVNWVMSVIVSDVSGDGRPDILFSERKGDSPGVRWLENPGDVSDSAAWKLHRIGETTTVLFMTVDDLDNDGNEDVIVITESDGVHFIRKELPDGTSWKTQKIAFPERVGSRGKGVSVADIDQDGKKDLILSFEKAEGDHSGIVFLSYEHSVFDPVWKRYEVSGAPGIKFDLVPVLDIDQDGDLDIVSTEENNNAKDGKAGLGLIWYENPKIK